VLALSTALALVAAVATVAVLSDGDDGEGTTESTIPLVPEGETRFTTFDDEVVALSSLHGGPVVVNFFASTCAPCISEMPAFEEVHQQLGDEVTFLGLAVTDQPEEALELVERTGVTYRTAQDKDGSAISDLGGTMLPATVLLDADGQIVGRHNGELDADELRDLIADELGVRV
jgi:thiol-disulfide isomerase/thioredoxin